MTSKCHDHNTQCDYCGGYLREDRLAKYDRNPNHDADMGHYCSTHCYDHATGQVR